MKEELKRIADVLEYIAKVKYGYKKTIQYDVENKVKQK